MIKQLFLWVSLTLNPLNENDKIIVENTSWSIDYDAALQTAQSNKKNVLVYFTGSDWCAPCKKLKKDLLGSKEFKTIASDYNLVYVNIPRNQDLISAEQYQKNKMLMGKLNKRKVFPLFVVVDSEGNLVDEHSGYSMNGHTQYHLAFLKKNK